MLIKNGYHKIYPTFSVLILILVLIILLNFAQILLKDSSQTKATPNPIRQAAERILGECKKEKDLELCYSRQFYSLTEERDSEFAKQTLFVLQGIDQKARGCHLIGHYIMRAQVKKDPSRWEEVLAQVDPNICTGGFIHGVFEASARSFIIEAKHFPICNRFGRGSFGERSCWHVLGHAIIAEQGANIPKAAAVCNKVKDFKARYECLSGLFMEYLFRDNIVTHGVGEKFPWNPENTKKIEKLCRSYSGLIAQACWKEISYMYVAIFDNEPAKIFAACNRAPERIFREECYIYGAGNMVVFMQFNPEKQKEVCTQYKEADPLFRKCIIQLTGSMLTSSEKFVPRVIDLCKGSPDWFKDSCFKNMGRVLTKNVPLREKRRQLCGSVPSEFQGFCIN